MRLRPFLGSHTSTVAEDSVLLKDAGWQSCTSFVLWAVLFFLIVKTVPLVILYQHETPTDLLCLYYGAKLLGTANIYDWASYSQAILADAEYYTLAKLPKHFQGFAPAPPPLYPPSSFILLKPLVWLGFHKATWWHLVSMPFFALLTALGAGQVAALVSRASMYAPRIAVAIIGFFLISPAYNQVVYLGQINLIVAAGLLWSLALATTIPVLSAALLVVTILLKPSGWLMALPFLYLWRGNLKALVTLAVLGIILFLAPGINTWLEYLSSIQGGTLKTWVEHTYKGGTPNFSIGMIAKVIEGTPMRVKLFQMVVSGLYIGAFGLLGFGFIKGKATLYPVASGAMLLSFLLGPISWAEHMVFILPFLLVMVLGAYRDFERGGFSTNTSFWLSWGVLLLTFLFCSSQLRFPLGPFARLNVLVAFSWHVLAAAGLFVQALATTMLFVRPLKKS